MCEHVFVRWQNLTIEGGEHRVLSKSFFAPRADSRGATVLAELFAARPLL